MNIWIAKVFEKRWGGHKGLSPCFSKFSDILNRYKSFYYLLFFFSVFYCPPLYRPIKEYSCSTSSNFVSSSWPEMWVHSCAGCIATRLGHIIPANWTEWLEQILSYTPSGGGEVRKNFTSTTAPLTQRPADLEGRVFNNNFFGICLW